jgi:hypothetical protein
VSQPYPHSGPWTHLHGMHKERRCLEVQQSRWIGRVPTCRFAFRRLVKSGGWDGRSYPSSRPTSVSDPNIHVHRGRCYGPYLHDVCGFISNYASAEWCENQKAFGSVQDDEISHSFDTPPHVLYYKQMTPSYQIQPYLRQARRWIVMIRMNIGSTPRR